MVKFSCQLGKTTTSIIHKMKVFVTQHGLAFSSMGTGHKGGWNQVHQLLFVKKKHQHSPGTKDKLNRCSFLLNICLFPANYSKPVMSYKSLHLIIILLADSMQ